MSWITRENALAVSALDVLAEGFNKNLRFIAKTGMSGQQNLPGLQEIKDYLKSFNFFERYVHGRWEGDLYVETHARRFLETLRFLPPLPPRARVLELGAVPYYMTVLLSRLMDFKLDTLSFFEVEQSDSATHTVESLKFNERFDFEYRAVNVERDVFPLADRVYDLVLCCEILEHLLINPSHMLYEAHRVLRPGGYLLITTPNVAQWENVFSLLRGRNIYDRYHGNGIYGRHNREYSPNEVAQLLEANSFSVERLSTCNVYKSQIFNRVPFVFSGRRDNIFALARSINSPRLGFPDNLYVLMEEYRNVVRPALVMGVDDVGQIGRGWHDFEPGDPGLRWSAKEATFYLRKTGAEKLCLHVRCDHPNINKAPVNLALHVNSTRLGTVELTDRNWHDLKFDLRNMSVGRLLQCQLLVSSTWVPKLETNSEDARELGVAVSRIWLE